MKILLTNLPWGVKERKGVIVGKCNRICEGGEAKADEYVPVKFNDGLQLIHKSKLVRR